MTMLQLSRGWQMRTPLDVRQRELRTELGPYAARPAPLPVPAPVFTLEPGALFAEGSRSADSDPEEWAARLCFVLLDDEPVADARGRELAQLWATSHQELAAYQQSVTMPKEHVRINARARLLGDLSLEVARTAQAADLNQPELSRWVLEHADDSIARMPYVGRLQEVIWHRLSNADERWEPNDLNDVHFLACAAAYAHVVVGERKTHRVPATRGATVRGWSARVPHTSGGAGAPRCARALVSFGPANPSPSPDRGRPGIGVRKQGRFGPELTFNGAPRDARRRDRGRRHQPANGC